MCYNTRIDFYKDRIAEIDSLIKEHEDNETVCTFLNTFREGFIQKLVHEEALQGEEP